MEDRRWKVQGGGRRERKVNQYKSNVVVTLSLVKASLCYKTQTIVF